MTTYSISLDDIDLALLPIPSCSNNFLKKELYEFRVMKTEEEDTSVNEMYHCHICAIDVPSAFSNAHNNGSKHQANVNIATEASKRMRQLLTFHPPTAHQSREEFCDPCSTTADDNHEKTKEHKVAVVHDRMLSELSNLYVGDCESETNDKPKGVAKSKEINNNTKIVGEVKRDDKSVANRDTRTIDVNAEVNSGDVKTATEYVKINMSTYLKILKSVPYAPKLALKGVCGNVQITIENVKLIVSSDQFHSFNRTGGETMCLICNVLVKPGEEEIHKLVLAHMKVLLQVVDEHCIRKVDETWSHCTLCNLRLTNIRVEAHNATNTHLEKQKESILSSHDIQLTDSEISEVKKTTSSFMQNNIEKSPVLQENVEPRNGTLNQLKPVSIPKIDKVVLAPNQMIPVKKEAKIEEVKNQPVKIITEIQSVFPVDDRVEYPFEPKDQGSVNCKICSCIVPKSINNRRDHLNGQRHAQNVKKHFPTMSEW